MVGRKLVDTRDGTIDREEVGWYMRRHDCSSGFGCVPVNSTLQTLPSTSGTGVVVGDCGNVVVTPAVLIFIAVIVCVSATVGVCITAPISSFLFA